MNSLAVFIVSTLTFATTTTSVRRDGKDCTLGNELVELVDCHLNNTDCSLEFKIGTCLSCEPTTCDIVWGACIFEYEVNSSFKPNLKTGMMLSKYSQPKSCQELEEEVCGAMNREGFLCSHCKSGYGLTPYSGTYTCLKCNDKRSGSRWLLYIALELLPSTAFFLVVIFFNIRVTSPPYTAFVFVSQFFALLYRIHPFVRLSLNLKVNKVFLQGVLTLVSFWNLDFFRHVVPPFCITSKLTDLHSLFLNFISAFYPLFLVFLTLSLIELHARNFRPLVILWKPFHSCCAHCRRKLDSTSSVIAASATFVTLAFSKILVTALLAIYTGSFVQGEDIKQRALYDPSVICNASAFCYTGLYSTPYFFPVLIVLLVVHLPIFLLCLYPIKVFRRILTCCCMSKYHAIYVFVDTFQGHYKDGTNGSRDYRAASSISFLLRTLFCLILSSGISRTGYPAHSNNYLILISVLIIASLFYGIFQPCKIKYMNVTECVVYSAACLVLLCLGTHSTSSPTGRFSISFGLYLSLILLVLPSVIILIMSLIKIFSCLSCFHKRLRVRNTLLSDQDFPDRMAHPQDYEPLI